MGRPGKILHGWEFWKKMGIIDLIGCECSKSLNPCHKPHKCLCFLKFMVYWATVASGFDSTTIASSNPFKSIEDFPLNLKGEERSLKNLKVNVFWMLCWQLHFMKWLFYPSGIFLKIISFCPKKTRRLEMELELADQEEHWQEEHWSSFKKLQRWMKMSCHGLHLLHTKHQQELMVRTADPFWALSSQEASALQGGNVTKARGTELPAREDPGMLRMATLCVIATLLTFPSLPETLVLHRIQTENCRNNRSFLL